MKFFATFEFGALINLVLDDTLHVLRPISSQSIFSCLISFSLDISNLISFFGRPAFPSCVR